MLKIQQKNNIITPARLMHNHSFTAWSIQLQEFAMSKPVNLVLPKNYAKKKIVKLPQVDYSKCQA